jgi:hypothetical protein
MATQEELCNNAVAHLLDEARYLPKSLVEELLAVSGEPNVPDEEIKFRVRGSCLHLLEFIEAIPDSLESELYAYLDQLGPLAANGHSL